MLREWQIPPNTQGVLNSSDWAQEDAVDYNRVVLRRKKKQAEDLLKKIEPKLQAIETLQTGSERFFMRTSG